MNFIEETVNFPLSDIIDPSWTVLRVFPLIMKIPLCLEQHNWDRHFSRQKIARGNSNIYQEMLQGVTTATQITPLEATGQ